VHQGYLHPCISTSALTKKVWKPTELMGILGWNSVSGSSTYDVRMLQRRKQADATKTTAQSISHTRHIVVKARSTRDVPVVATSGCPEEGVVDDVQRGLAPHLPTVTHVAVDALVVVVVAVCTAQFCKSGIIWYRSPCVGAQQRAVMSGHGLSVTHPCIWG
jgi:hypothetical protein